MILFSTILKINETLTKDAFVRLVLKWNETSAYEVNRVPDISWNGEYTKKFGTDKLSLEFVDYPEKLLLDIARIVAIYMVLCIAVILLSFQFVIPLFRMMLPEFWAKLVNVAFMVVCVSPFLRAIVTHTPSTKLC